MLVFLSRFLIFSSFFLFSVFLCSGFSQMIYVDSTENCVEPGGIILTTKPVSKYKINLDGKEIYIMPVPVTAEKLEGFSICEKEFPVEIVKFKRREYVNPDPQTVELIRNQKKFLRNIFGKEPTEKMWEGNFIFPLKNYKRVVKNFGARRIINGVPGAFHRGIDISARMGEKVYASNSGVVAVAREFVLEGNLVVINHGTGIYTIYAHLKKILVKEGDFVKKGQVIGYVGNTGRSLGPHLHFGAKIGTVDINPYALFEIKDKLLLTLSSIH